MRTLFTLGFALMAFSVFGQDCDCKSQLSYVIKYYEENNPAFQKLENDAEEAKKYNSEKAKLLEKARLEKDDDACIIHLDRYVSLLKDHHSDIGFQLKRIDLSSPELIAAFKTSERYRQFPKKNIDTLQLIPYLKAKEFANIEGIYSDGGKIVFGIVKKKKSKNTYEGIVLKSNKLLNVGHILMELTQKDKNLFDVSYNVGLLGFNFNRVLKSMKIENGQLASFGFSKVQTGSESSDKPYEFKALTDSVNYLRLSDFDARLTDKLDAFYNEIDQAIQSKPYLIVDLRNNGGGSERSYLNLLPYAYTRPLKIDPSSVWVSPENIKRYEETSEESNKELIDRMKKATPFTFIPQSEKGQDTYTIENPTAYPKKIVLLFNKGTASAAEGLITYFQQSDKVITVGENSGGYIGYGNVMTAEIPCGKFKIRSTTTRYEEKSKYEFVGIPPMHKIAKEKDWVKYALSLFAAK